MNFIRKYVLAIILVIIIGILVISNHKTSQKSTGISDGQAYNATSTLSGGPWNSAPFFKVLKTGYGVLGSVIITNSTAGAISLYDGTTTNALLRTNPATTTLAVIGASVAAGTYVFDVSFSTGLVVDFPSGLAASSTITWR